MIYTRKSISKQALTLVFSIMLGHSTASKAGAFEDGKEAGARGDYKAAMQYFLPLANRNDAKAQFFVGFMNYRGDGVPKNWREAMRWFRLSAAQGNANAQFFIGLMHENGEEVAKDYAEAFRWYRLSADQRDADAQSSLGRFYLNGLGVTQDYAEGLKWIRLAAHQGESRAQKILGGMYAEGKHVLRNDIEAHKWLNLAGIDGDEDARRLRAIVESDLTPEQLVYAQKLANSCRSSEYKDCEEPEFTDARVKSSKPQTISARNVGSTNSPATAIPLQKHGGTFIVSVLINGAMTLEFVLDSGAADVSIPSDVVKTLMRTGTLRQADFLGEKKYVLADGSSLPSQTFLLRSIAVGNHVIENVTANMAPEKGSLLLGQSFLSRFKSWSIDNKRQVLLLQ